MATGGDGFDERRKLHKRLRVTALGGGRGSFLLEMGGCKLLVNPVLTEGGSISPKNAHKKADFVILTSGRPQFFDEETLGQMKLSNIDFVAADGAGELLERMLVRNKAVLAAGPGGRTLVQGQEGTAEICIMVVPGTAALPWQPTELGFIFINMETGVAVAYEAQGQFLGENAATSRPGIPDEAFQVDHLITPDLREAAGVAKGLTAKGTVLRSVVRLPKHTEDQKEAQSEGFNPLLALDAAVDKALGAIEDDASEFRDFLQKQGSPLSKTRLLEASVGGGPVDLE